MGISVVSSKISLGATEGLYFRKYHHAQPDSCFYRPLRDGRSSDVLRLDINIVPAETCLGADPWLVLTLALDHWPYKIENQT